MAAFAETPRLSQALRAKAGLRPLPLSEQTLQRRAQLAALPPREAPAATGGATLTWEAFAGAFSRSSEPHARAARLTEPASCSACYCGCSRGAPSALRPSGHG